MQPLQLTPLPTVRTEAEAFSLQMEREGFVDELAITALTAPAKITRSMAQPSDLALAADDMDFAGWSMSPFDRAEIRAAAAPRRATPPVIPEPGLGEPHTGSHRWWLAGLAGIFSTLLFSALLLNLSARSGPQFEAVLSPGAFVRPKPTAILPPSKIVPAPELTDVSWQRP